MEASDDNGRPHGRHHHPRDPGAGRPESGAPHQRPGGGRGGSVGTGAPGEGRGRGRGRGRAARGDVRTAVLLLLAEQPMHGYQLMQAIGERTDGAWRPSPGAVYPTINQLEDEGLVSVVADAGRRLVTLTEAGSEQLRTNREAWGDPFADHRGGAPGVDLRRLVHDVHEAARLVGRTGSDAQRAAAGRILGDARRALFLLLAEGPEADLRDGDLAHEQEEDDDA